MDETGKAAFVHSGHGLAAQSRGLHRDPQGTGYQAADVDEAEASLVLLVHLVGAGGDPRVEQADGGSAAAWLDDGGGACDAALLRREQAGQRPGAAAADEGPPPKNLRVGRIPLEGMHAPLTQRIRHFSRGSLKLDVADPLRPTDHCCCPGCSHSLLRHRFMDQRGSHHRILPAFSHHPDEIPEAATVQKGCRLYGYSELFLDTGTDPHGLK